jgi:hypothetical protein
MNLRILVLGTLLVSRVPATAGAPDARGVEFFEKKIRPVLVEHCYQCHSAAAQKNKKLRSGLLLDSRAGILKGGDSGPALVPGKVNEGHLLAALRYAGDVKMPPNGRLPDEIVADFKRWVEMGLPDPRQGVAPAAAKTVIDPEQGRQYWAFRPLVAAEPRQVPGDTWSRNPVDRFIMAGLKQKGLAPNPPVDRVKLIRRAYYDLWGLPPTPAEVDAFVSDAAPDAYEKLVDRLLDSPHYGERWARHWLDVVRYAESGGYEFDKDRPGAYHYRDFVIRALNQDLPYDEFVRLQLAGDHLQPGDYSAAAATGFLVAGPFPGQTTAKTRELIRYNHLDDMVSTLGTSLLGLSLGCARCHDHKYDPLPQQDYYRLVATLGRTDSADLQLDPEPDATRRSRADFAQAHAPFVARREQFEQDVMPGRAQAWWAKNQGKAAPTWRILDPTDVQGASVKRPGDGSVLVPGKVSKNEVYTVVTRTEQKGITALRLEALADPSLPRSGPGRGAAGEFLLTELSLTATPLNDPQAKPVAVKLRAAHASSEAKGRPLKATLDADKKSGWAPAEAGKDALAIFEIEGEVGFAGGTVLTLTLKFEGDGAALGRFRTAFTTAARPVPADAPAALQHTWELLTALDREGGKVTAKNRAAVSRWFRAFDAETEKVLGAEEAHARREPQPALATVFAAASGRGGDVFFLTRGEVERKTGKAEPGFLQVLMNAPDKDRHWLGSGGSAPTATPVAGKGPREVKKAAPLMAPSAGSPIPGPRVGLAEWITDPDAGAGPLLARVIVNRLWQHHLGRGIVATPNDFGVQGEPPTHPELLDWLAADFIRGGWKLKRLHKLIMTSAVYQQGGELNPAAQDIDPQNKLWWRRPPRRLEAEAIRDAVLAVGGSLDRTLYGPGSLDAASARRSVYLKVKRSQLVPMLQMFDAPEAIQSIGERSTTTVATQSLALMNAPVVRAQAEKLARRARPQGGEVGPAIAEAYRIALGRRPSEAEQERMTAFVRRQAESYGAPQGQERAMTDFCQILLCLNEFIYID